MPKKVPTHRHFADDFTYGVKGRTREEYFTECSLLLDQLQGTQWTGWNPNWLTRVGQRCTLTGIIKKVRFWFYRTGDPTGSIYCRIRRRSDDVILQTSSLVLNIPDIPTSDTMYEFPFDLEVDNLEIRISLEVVANVPPYWQTGVREVRICYIGTDVCQGGEIEYTTYWIEWMTYDCKIQVLGVP